METTMTEIIANSGEEEAAVYGACEGYFRDSHGTMRPCLVRSDPWPIDSFVNFKLSLLQMRHTTEKETDPEEETQLPEMWGEEDDSLPGTVVLSPMKRMIGLNDFLLLTENESSGAGSDLVQLAIESCGEKFGFYREPDANCNLVDYNPPMYPRLITSTVLIGNSTRSFIHDALEHAELHTTRICKRDPGLEAANGEGQTRRQTNAQLKTSKERTKQSKQSKGKKKAQNIIADIKVDPKQDDYLSGPLSDEKMQHLELQARLEEDIVCVTSCHPCYAYVNCWAAPVPTLEGDHHVRKLQGIPGPYIHEISDDDEAGYGLANQQNVMQHPLPINEVQGSVRAANGLPAAWNANIPSIDVNAGSAHINVQTGMMRLQVPDPIILGDDYDEDEEIDLVANPNPAAFDFCSIGILESNVRGDMMLIQPPVRGRMNSVPANGNAANGVVETGLAARRKRDDLVASPELQVQSNSARVELEGVNDEQNGKDEEQNSLPVEIQDEDALIHGRVRSNVDADRAGANVGSYVQARALHLGLDLGLPPLPNRRPLGSPRVNVLRKPRSNRPRKRSLRNL